LAAQHAVERLKRTEAAIIEFLPSWSLAPVVDALQALRGVQLVTAATIMVEIGDLRRFNSPRQLMGYLGLVPGERSTGDSVRRTGSGQWPGAARAGGERLDVSASAGCLQCSDGDTGVHRPAGRITDDFARPCVEDGGP